MILLTEKNQIRKNIGFDLSNPDQKLAYDILEMKRGKSLSRFLAKSIIIGEMIERKMQTDKIERRGNCIRIDWEIIKTIQQFISTSFDFISLHFSFYHFTNDDGFSKKSA